MYRYAQANDGDRSAFPSFLSISFKVDFPASLSAQCLERGIQHLLTVGREIFVLDASWWQILLNFVDRKSYPAAIFNVEIRATQQDGASQQKAGRRAHSG